MDFSRAIAGPAAPIPWYQLKDDREGQRVVIEFDDIDPVNPLGGAIRCPVCDWRPTADSRWSCSWSGAPEPFFESCGTVWNTFTTRGQCPGCSHQWLWTSCLRCGEWSLHRDWYRADYDPPEELLK
jgi:hypothetical protein